MADYPTDAEVIARCWDGVDLSGVPCVGGTGVISAGMSSNVIVDGFFLSEILFYFLNASIV